MVTLNHHAPTKESKKRDLNQKGKHKRGTSRNADSATSRGLKRVLKNAVFSRQKTGEGGFQKKKKKTGNANREGKQDGTN